MAHVGVEYSHKRVLKLARRIARTELANVRLVEDTAEHVLSELLAPQSVGSFWINFPDPWPKKRHHRRRLVQSDKVALLADRLVPGGILVVGRHLEEYAEQIDAVLAAEPALENTYAPARFLSEVPDRLPTAYELEWRSEGRPLYFWTYRRQWHP